MKRKTLMIGLGSVLSLFAAGCGGGGGGGDNGGSSGGTSGGSGGGGTSGGGGSGASAEGLYVGTTANHQDVVGLVLDDGGYWFIYLAGSVIGGVVQGTGSYHDDGSFTSSNAKDFSAVERDISDVGVNATVVLRSSLNGTLSYSGGTKLGFTTGYNSDYELRPSLSTLNGSYRGVAATSDGQETALVSITASGAISGAGESGCKFSGTAAPRAHGNVYDISITFGGGECANGTDTVKGSAYFDGPTQQLFSVGVNGSRSNGFIYIGEKS